MHGMFHVGGSSDSIDPRLDQCRRLCCDMASTASTANFIHPLKEASRLNLSPIRGPPTRPTTARSDSPAQEGRSSWCCYIPTYYSPPAALLPLLPVSYYSLSATRQSDPPIPTSATQSNPSSLSADTDPNQQHHPAAYPRPHVTNVHLSRLARQTLHRARMVHR